MESSNYYDTAVHSWACCQCGVTNILYIGAPPTSSAQLHTWCRFCNHHSRLSCCTSYKRNGKFPITVEDKINEKIADAKKELQQENDKLKLQIAAMKRKLDQIREIAS